MNKEKFNIIYKYFAKPIADMKMTYNIEASIVDPRVTKCFDNLIRALNIQLNMYRNRK